MDLFQDVVLILLIAGAIIYYISNDGNGANPKPMLAW